MLNGMSKEFMDEFKKRGFDLKKDNGGSYYDYLSDMSVNKINDDLYKIGDDVSIISSMKFLEVVIKIQKIKGYKLFS